MITAQCTFPSAPETIYTTIKVALLQKRTVHKRIMGYCYRAGMMPADIGLLKIPGAQVLVKVVSSE